MTAFHTIAVPHEDILAGRLTLDVFAADLWEVYQRRAPDEYRDPVRFFQKTYQTEGLTHLLDVVAKRLRGEGGDPVIQVQTPFGGGKTHALIAMYHQAAEWGARRAVVVGTPRAPTETIWGLLAEQLAGSRAGFDGLTAPGREALRALLAAHQPLLILMDEVLEYATKAAGVPVGESTLAAQTLAFFHELTEAVSTLERVCLVVTLPSSVLEHYDEAAERLFKQLQKELGRVEKIYTPVQEHEITGVIRRRLFSAIDEKRAQEVIAAFLDYASGESLLPPGVEPSEYRRRFAASYPFLPEVVDVLYQRWGSFTSFQRTRGVLRLLFVGGPCPQGAGAALHHPGRLRPGQPGDPPRVAQAHRPGVRQRHRGRHHRPGSGQPEGGPGTRRGLPGATAGNAGVHGHLPVFVHRGRGTGSHAGRGEAECHHDRQPGQRGGRSAGTAERPPSLLRAAPGW
jgi:predicted AAA+ superfamily ATPase